MQKNISIQLSRFLMVIFLVLFLGAATWFAIDSKFYQAWQDTRNQVTARAAETGVRIFYTIDYREGIDSWVKSLCEVSTVEGCEIANTFYRDYIWPRFEEDKVRTTVEIRDSEMILDLEGQQIWRVGCQPGSIWVGIPIPELGYEDVYLLIEEDIDKVWKMVRLLSDTEVKSLFLEVEGG